MMINRLSGVRTARLSAIVLPALLMGACGIVGASAAHVSDSVNVIDVAPDSPTRFTVVATIQDFDPLTKATRFDEPVGIAFAETDGTATKAYVALSSENQIAVIDVASRSVTGHLSIPAQDPRAISVRNGRLYVAAFESHNQTQLSGGRGDQIDGDLVTFDAWQHSIFHNNVLSIGHEVDIVKHPDVPDRDLFVFDTEDDSLVETVSGLGRLLYGLAISDDGSVLLTGEGLWLDADRPTPVHFTVIGNTSDPLATYQETGGSGGAFSTTDLADAAADGRLLVTFTARGCSSVTAASPQPAIWTTGPLEQQRGRQRFPRLAPGETRMTASGRHVHPDAMPLVDGRKAAGSVTINGDELTVDLAEPPAAGMHLLQLQNPDGLASNDFLFFVRNKAEEDQDDDPADRESLAGILKAAGWEGIVGTWVDKATKGTIAKTTYRWSLPGRVMEVRNEGGETPSVALIGVNPTNGDVFHVGGDSKGSSFLGTWNIDDGGVATLALQIAAADGNEFRLQVRHELLDADTMRTTIQLPQPIVIDLVRATE